MVLGLDRILLGRTGWDWIEQDGIRLRWAGLDGMVIG